MPMRYAAVAMLGAAIVPTAAFLAPAPSLVSVARPVRGSSAASVRMQGGEPQIWLPNAKQDEVGWPCVRCACGLIRERTAWIILG